MVNLRVLSLGAGVQSTTLLLLANYGEIERPDVAIFADTGWEPDRVYRHLEKLEEISKIPIIRVSSGNLKEDYLKKRHRRKASMPLFTEGGGRLKRQCTPEYKVIPINRKIRKILGRKRVSSKTTKVVLDLGFSIDEICRLKENKESWIENNFPLIDLGFTRRDCLNWILEKGFSEPPKSSCVCCPFHDDFWWRQCRDNSFDEWEEACFFDEKIRRLPRIKENCYLHRSCVPLREARLETNNMEFAFMDGFIEECDGMCGY